jgi:hypothetical protein
MGMKRNQFFWRETVAILEVNVSIIVAGNQKGRAIGEARDSHHQSSETHV